MKIRAFITQHEAEKISECQDRFSVNNETKIIAVSDGVSQSIFPDCWAELLVEHYTMHGQLSEGDRISLCSEWNQLVLKYISEERQKGNNPWRTESNLHEGISAGATLCGVKFTDEVHWVCQVLGDSCLIKVHDCKLVEILSSEEKAFDTYPDFLDSNPLRKGRGVFKSYEGNLSENDKIIIVSDPFSDFFYKLRDGSSQYIEQLLSVSNHEEFVLLVEDWRRKGMHNDDSTVVIAEWDGSPYFDLVAIDKLDVLIENEINNISENAEISVVEPEEHIAQENIDETSPICTAIKMEDSNEFEKIQANLIAGIPSFVHDFIESKINAKNHLGNMSLIDFILKKKNKRIAELRKILETMLNGYVKTIK